MNREANETILVGMGGGVDSSMAALLLKQAGYRVKGVILRMHDAQMTQENLVNGKLPQNIWYAREAARRIRLDFSLFDIRETFRERGEAFFIESGQKGWFPDPGIFCTDSVLFPELFRIADKLECDKVAAGYYARVEYREDTGRYTIRKGEDIENDQSFLLYGLTQEELSRLVLPLGTHQKADVRKMAEDARLKNVRIPMPDTLYDGDETYAASVNAWIAEHIALAPEQLPALTEDPSGADSTDTVRLGKVCYAGYEAVPADGMRIHARMSCYGPEYAGTVYSSDGEYLKVRFDAPMKRPIPGRSMVLYADDIVAAGGIVIESM